MKFKINRDHFANGLAQVLNVVGSKATMPILSNVLIEAEKDAAYKSDPDVASKDGGTLLDQMMEAKHIKFPANSKPYEQLEAACK